MKVSKNENWYKTSFQKSIIGFSTEKPNKEIINIPN